VFYRFGQKKGQTKLCKDCLPPHAWQSPESGNRKRVSDAEAFLFIPSVHGKALVDAANLFDEIMRGEVKPEVKAEKWLQTYFPRLFPN